MLNKIKNYINDNKLMPQNAKVVLAFSYGIDSAVCLDILLKLGYDVVLAHVNHKHRAESEIEEAEAKALANKLNLDIHVLTLKEDFSLNFHADAHNKRYAFYKEVAKLHNTDIIVTAHHLNDNAETIFLSLLRGSNLYGYSGIQPLVKKDGFNFVRPLMCLTKEQIINYQKENNIKYYEDSSNAEDKFSRNRIRHHIIPMLIKENPNLLNQLSDYSNILKTSFDFIRSQSIKLLDCWNNKIVISEFRQLHEALRDDIISLWLERLNIERSYNLIKDISNSLIKDKPQLSLNIKDGFVLKKRYDIACIDHKTQKNDFLFEMYENDVILVKNTRFYFTKNLPDLGAKYIKLCYNNLVFPLILRSRKPGDTILMTYGHKKVKDLFIDLHLTHEQRDNAIILENNKEILWIYDYAKSKDLIDMKKKGDIYLVCEVINNEK